VSPTSSRPLRDSESAKLRSARLAEVPGNLRKRFDAHAAHLAGVNAISSDRHRAEVRETVALERLKRHARDVAIGHAKDLPRRAHRELQLIAAGIEWAEAEAEAKL
jgi:hypothetical protein